MVDSGWWKNKRTKKGTGSPLGDDDLQLIGRRVAPGANTAKYCGKSPSHNSTFSSFRFLARLLLLHHHRLDSTRRAAKSWTISPHQRSTWCSVRIAEHPFSQTTRTSVFLASATA